MKNEKELTEKRGQGSGLIAKEKQWTHLGGERSNGIIVRLQVIK